MAANKFAPDYRIKPLTTKTMSSSSSEECVSTSSSPSSTSILGYFDSDESNAYHGKRVDEQRVNRDKMTKPKTHVSRRKVDITLQETDPDLLRASAALCAAESAEFSFTQEQERRSRQSAENATYRLSEILASAIARPMHRAQRFAEVEASFKHNCALSLFDVTDREEVLQSFAAQESARLRKSRTRVGANDFAVIQNLGQGGFGDVFLVQHKRSLRFFAMKEISKHERQRDRDRLMVERSILAAAAATRSRWLVHLAYSFQDYHASYLVMGYEPGGSLTSVLESQEKLREAAGGTGPFMSESQVRFYFSEMILAVDALHRLGFVHRDLKPDNFLISAEGHIKIVDFGLAAPLGLARNPSTDIIDVLSAQSSPWLGNPATASSPSKTLLSSLRLLTHRRRVKKLKASTQRQKRAFSVVGSPEYMAPEVIGHLGYGVEADWWSMGVNLFELFTGTTPFLADSVAEVFDNIREADHVLSCLEMEAKSAGMTDTAWDLSRLLMHNDSTVRVGSKKGIYDLLHHEFFSPYPHPHPADIVTRIDVAAFEDYVIHQTPPHVPEVKNVQDTESFAGSFVENRRQKLNNSQRVSTMEGFAFTSPDEAAKQQSLSHKSSCNSSVGSSESNYISAESVVHGGSSSSTASASSVHDYTSALGRRGVRLGFDEGFIDGRRRSSSLPSQVDFDRVNRMDAGNYNGNLLSRDVSIPMSVSPLSDSEVLLTKARDAVRPGARTADEILCRKVFKLMVDLDDHSSLIRRLAAPTDLKRRLFSKPSNKHPASRIFERKQITKWLVFRLGLSEMDSSGLLDKLLSFGYLIIPSKGPKGSPNSLHMRFQLFCGLDVFCINSLRRLERPSSPDAVPLMFEELGHFFFSCRSIASASLESEDLVTGGWVPSVSTAALFVASIKEGLNWDVKEERQLMETVVTGRRAFDRFMFLSPDLSQIGGLSTLQPDELLCFLLNCHNALAIGSVIHHLRCKQLLPSTLWSWLFRARQIARDADSAPSINRAVASAMVGPAFSIENMPVPPFTLILTGGKVTVSDLAILILAGSCADKKSAYDRVMRSDGPRQKAFAALPVSMRRDVRLAMAAYMLHVNDDLWYPQVFQARSLDSQLDLACKHAFSGRVRVNTAKRIIFVPSCALRVLDSFPGVASFLEWVLSFSAEPEIIVNVRSLLAESRKIKLQPWVPSAHDTREVKPVLDPKTSFDKRKYLASSPAPMPEGRPRSNSAPLWFLDPASMSGLTVDSLSNSGSPNARRHTEGQAEMPFRPHEQQAKAAAKSKYKQESD